MISSLEGIGREEQEARIRLLAGTDKQADLLS